MNGFWGTLNYTSVNEDWRTETAALRLRDGNCVLAITGSGSHVIGLLAVADVDVVGIDLDGPQNHLLWVVPPRMCPPAPQVAATGSPFGLLHRVTQRMPPLTGQNPRVDRPPVVFGPP